MPRITRKVFTDLAIFMVGLGLFMGIIFPPFVVLLGMPAANAFSPLFMVACIAAGLCVGGLNWVLAHRIVGQRLRVLTVRMDEVSREVEKVGQADDWWKADPARWRIPVDSDDVLGASAGAFDRLVDALARSLRYEKAGRSFAEIIVSAQTVRDLSRAALDCLVLESGADAGAILTQDALGLQLQAVRGVANTEAVLACETIGRALETRQTADKVGRCDLELSSPGTVRELFAVPFFYGGETRGVVLIAAVEPLGAYGRSVTELFARDFGVAVATAARHERLVGAVAVGGRAAR